MELTGFHHLTAITADARANKRFMTEVLGLRLVKRSVNQDDPSAYHLFFADGRGRPGTDITFFTWPVGRERRGTNAITRTGLVVPAGSLDYWIWRLADEWLPRSARRIVDGHSSVDFEDIEGQRYRLVEADAAATGPTWEYSPIPAAYQIIGLGPITLSVPDIAPTRALFCDILNMQPAGSYADPDDIGRTEVFRMGGGGLDARLHVTAEAGSPVAHQGAGAVHHLAFRTPDAERLAEWKAWIESYGIRVSDIIDRHYFRSIYFRDPSGIQLEIATDGPGFEVDEPAENMGEKLILPPWLESRRDEIVGALPVID
ncbi:VOC family protein [Paracoccus pacificus]|uniref:VOC family protein n=1 Tax=Paracoccus pacificus TaxID=1463598 RepID=A0ABW4R6F1_9RHOB